MKLVNDHDLLIVSGGSKSSNYDLETSFYGFFGTWIGSIGAVVAIDSLSAPYNNPLLKIAGFFVGSTVGRTVGHVFGAGLYHMNQNVISGVDSYFKPVDVVEKSTM